MKELSKVREQRAISAAPAMIIKKTEWSDSESDEAQALIIRLEQELAGIERQRVDELEQIDGWKEQEMKRVHREASDALQESCLLEGLVKSNKERVQELRAERKRLTSDHDALRCGLRTMQEEHRHLTLESVKLRSHLKDTQEYTEAETKRGADWAMVQRKYEEHMQDLQRMIEERESRTAMEERRKKVYGRVVLEIVQVVQNHEVVKEQELIGFVRSADLASCSPLYAA
jgi:regulator of replication initiation timing